MAGRSKIGQNYIARQVTLTPTQDMWLDTVAKERGVSRAAIIRDALDAVMMFTVADNKTPAICRHCNNVYCTC